MIRRIAFSALVAGVLYFVCLGLFQVPPAWAQVPTGSFSFAIVPDIHLNNANSAPQSCCGGCCQPQAWQDQSTWLTSPTNVSAWNIQAYFYTGDCTGQDAEYQTADIANVWTLGWSAIDATGKPWLASEGNHDSEASGYPQTRNTTTWDAQMGYSRVSGKSWFGGYYSEPNSNANTYIKFSVGTRNFLVFALEFFARPEVLTWASGVIVANPTREVIVITHGAVQAEGTYSPFSGTNSGPSLYTFVSGAACDGTYAGAQTGPGSTNYSCAGTDLIAWAQQYRNVRAIFNGHFVGNPPSAVSPNHAHRSDLASDQHPILGFFTNYQQVAGAHSEVVLLATFSRNTITLRNLNTTTGVVDETKHPPYTLAWESNGLFPLPSAIGAR